MSSRLLRVGVSSQGVCTPATGPQMSYGQIQGQTGGWKDRQMDGWTDKWVRGTTRWMDRWREGRTDKWVGGAGGPGLVILPGPSNQITSLWETSTSVQLPCTELTLPSSRDSTRGPTASSQLPRSPPSCMVSCCCPHWTQHHHLAGICLFTSLASPLSPCSSERHPLC